MSTLTYPKRRKYPARLYELRVGQRITIRRRTYAPDVRDLEMFRHRIYFAARRGASTVPTASGRTSSSDPTMSPSS